MRGIAAAAGRRLRQFVRRHQITVENPIELRLLLAILGITISPAVAADAQVGAKKAQICIVCHKLAQFYSFPLLDSQPKEYLYIQMKGFKDKRRAWPGKQPNVTALPQKDMRDIAEYFSAQKMPGTPFRIDTSKVAIGKEKAEELKCADCHMPDFSGNDVVPRLAGQVPEYLIAQLDAFRSGIRPHGSGPTAEPSRNPNAQDSELLGHYFAARQ
jgi:cytochrome c553